MHPGSSNPGHSGHQRLRFYIVIVTLVIGGVLFLLLLNNNNPNGFSLTSAIVGEMNSSKVSTDDALSPTGTTLQKINKVFSEEVAKTGREVPILLSFDEIPTVKKDTKVDEIELYFDDLTTTINVNDDKLELNNIKEVKLTLKGFSGSLSFNEEGIGLKGIASRIEVNDVAFSSEKTISISLHNLNYQRFDLRGISLKDVDFPAGSGSLTVSDKLTYTLEEEAVKLYSFRGQFSSTKEGNSTAATTLDGTMQGISISGQELGINVW